MRSYHIQQSGSLDGLVCRERDQPVPGAFEVLVRVHANSLNSRDYNLLMGDYGMKPRPDMVPLCDGAGEVVAIGPGVTRFAAGDRVAAIFHQGWVAGPRLPEHPRGDLGGSLDGLLADYVVLNEQGWVRIPKNLSFAEAATLPGAGVTAWNALMAHGPLLPGQVVLVQGTGGVAVFAAQLALLAGARVIALSSSDEKLERMKALGVQMGVNYVRTPDWEKEVMRLTDRRGVDLAIEVVGNLDKTFRATRIGGQISFIGRLGDKEANVSLVPVQLRNLRIVGIGVGSRADFENLVRAIEAHDFHPLIDQTFPFEQARAAFEAFGRHGHMGKIVIENP